MEESSFNYSPANTDLMEEKLTKSNLGSALSEYETKLLLTMKKGFLDEIIEQNIKSVRNKGESTLKKGKFAANLNFNSHVTCGMVSVKNISKKKNKKIYKN